MSEIQTFQQKLNAAIEKSGMKKAPLARLLAVPYQTFQHWCFGERVPPEYLQRAILAEIERIVEENK